MKRTLYWLGGIGAAAVLAFGLNQMSEDSPRVIKTYTENGREITLLDLDGNPATAEERVTRGRFPAFGSEPPVGGYTEKREFEPPVEKDGRKTNTEISFYDKDRKRVEGPIRTLEPREGRLEIPEDRIEKKEPAYLAEIRRYFDAIEKLTEINIVDDIRYLHHDVSHQEKDFPDVKDLPRKEDQIPSLYPMGLLSSRGNYIIFKYRNSSTQQETNLPAEVEIIAKTIDPFDKGIHDVSFNISIGEDVRVSFTEGVSINGNRYRTVSIASSTIQFSSFDIDEEDIVCEESGNNFAEPRGEKIPSGTRIDGSKVLRAVEHFRDQATKVEDMFYASLAKKVRDRIVEREKYKVMAGQQSVHTNFNSVFGYVDLIVPLIEVPHESNGRGWFPEDGGLNILLTKEQTDEERLTTEPERLVYKDTNMDGKISVNELHLLDMNRSDLGQVARERTEQYRNFLPWIDDVIGD